MSRSSITALAGLAVMAVGVLEIVLYGFVPVSALPMTLQPVAGGLLMLGIVLLPVVGVWLFYSTALDRETHIHDILIGLFMLTAAAGTALYMTGPVTVAELGTFSIEALGYLLVGLLGLGGAFALTIGGYILYRQPGRADERFPALFSVYKMTGIAVALFILLAGLELIEAAVVWSGLAGWISLVAGLAWIGFLVAGNIFALKSVARLHTDQGTEDLFDAFAPETSPVTQLWKLYGMEVLEADTDSVRFSGPQGTDLELRQIEADRPSIREYRAIKDGKAISTTLLAFDDCGDGADVTMETVTDRTLSLFELPLVYARARFNDLVLEEWGFQDEESWIHVGIGGIEHEF